MLFTFVPSAASAESDVTVSVTDVAGDVVTVSGNAAIKATDYALILHLFQMATEF